MATANLETRKKALIIGNNDYQVNPLRSCKNDAEDVAKKFRAVDFDVTIGCNLTYLQMSKQIMEFTRNITQEDFVVFFFSGHGNQLDGENYLIAIDNQEIVNDRDLCKEYATCAQTAHDRMMKKKPIALIFLLDCSRTNIGPTTGMKSMGQTNNSIGFASMQSCTSSMIVFACGPNQEAWGSSPNRRNSLFTYHLLDRLIEPNLKVEEMMSLIGGDVFKDSKGELQVHRSTNLLTPYIYFNSTGNLSFPLIE